MVFAIILIAELPDKSMFASLVLGTRFNPRWVFAGVAAAFAVHVVIAVAAGSLLTLAPRRVVEIIVTVLFLLGALLLFRESVSGESDEQDELDAKASTPDAASRRGALAVFGTSFGVIFVGEFGDITQITTANLAARYDDPLSVGLGALLGLWAAALLAIALGKTLLKYVSVVLLHRVGAVILLGFAVYSAIQAIRG